MNDEQIERFLTLSELYLRLTEIRSDGVCAEYAQTLIGLAIEFENGARVEIGDLGLCL
jgi:hypothetical protein